MLETNISKSRKRIARQGDIDLSLGYAISCTRLWLIGSVETTTEVKGEAGTLALN
jgi:hypothetical protein